MLEPEEAEDHGSEDEAGKSAIWTTACTCVNEIIRFFPDLAWTDHFDV